MSMLELFRLEAEEQVQALTEGLLALERVPTASGQLEACMRAAHSIKGAARIVGLEAGVRIAHSLEDCFVAAQRGQLVLQQSQIDLLLRGVDLLNRVAAPAGGGPTAGERSAQVDAFLEELAAALENPAATGPSREGSGSSRAACAASPEDPPTPLRPSNSNRRRRRGGSGRTREPQRRGQRTTPCDGRARHFRARAARERATS